MRILCSADFSSYSSRPGAFDNRLAYVLGLQRLGHEVYLVDDVNQKRCLDDDHEQVPFERWAGRQRFEALARWYGVWPRSCLIFNQGEATYGMSLGEIVKVAKTSDVLISIGRALRTEEVWEPVECRVYVDLAPGKTQIYEAEYGIDYGLSCYHHFFSLGLSIGQPDCEIPTCGVTWRGLFHPVVLAMWPEQVDAGCQSFTTISNWSRRHTFNYRGTFSGDKEDNWRRFVELPRHTSRPMEVALDIHPAFEEDIQLFRKNGWILKPGVRTVPDYRSYIARSRAEFSVANDRVVQFDTGFLSDRTARYLASGKPVVVQSAGIENHLPVGKGFLTFRTIDEAVAGIEAIDSDYVAHCRAARAIAEEYLDSDRVLAKMLSDVVGNEALAGARVSG